MGTGYDLGGDDGSKTLTQSDLTVALKTLQSNMNEALKTLQSNMTEDLEAKVQELLNRVNTDIKTATNPIIARQTEMKDTLDAWQTGGAPGLAESKEEVGRLTQRVETLEAGASQKVIVNTATAGREMLDIERIIKEAQTSAFGRPIQKNVDEYLQLLDRDFPVDQKTGQVVRQAQYASGYSPAGLTSAVPAQQNLINLVTTASELSLGALDQLEAADETSDKGKRLIKLIRANLQALQKAAASEEQSSRPLIKKLVEYLKEPDIASLKKEFSSDFSSPQREAQLTAWADLVSAAGDQIETAFNKYWGSGAQDEQSEATQRLQLIGEDLRQLENAYDQAGLSRVERNLEPVTNGSESTTVQSVLSSVNRLLEMGPDLLDAGKDGLDRLKEMAGTAGDWVGVLPDLDNTMVKAARDELKDHLDGLAP